jgi:hypothetical protein
VHPEISDAFWAEFKIEVQDYLVAHSSELLDIIAQVYAERFSEDELHEAIAYAETGMGKKLADPALKAEASKRGEVWGEKVGETISTQVIAKLKVSGTP